MTSQAATSRIFQTQQSWTVLCLPSKETKSGSQLEAGTVPSSGPFGETGKFPFLLAVLLVGPGRGHLTSL